MRIGKNPEKGTETTTGQFVHQVVIPVFIPDQEDYYSESFRVFKLCLASLQRTVHHQTWITIVDNGCCVEVRTWLSEQFQSGGIHEVVHAGPIGKPNAMIKGLAGNNMELVTFSDADVFFCSGWQQETQQVFRRLPKAGVVGLVPQFKMFPYCCGNVIFDMFFSGKLKFFPVKSPDDMQHFYKSIGWTESVKDQYLNNALGLDYGDWKVLVGSGHFVATYKRDIFDRIVSGFKLKLGKGAMLYFDRKGLKKDYWRLTTHQNFAYHMGNKPEAELEEKLLSLTPFSGPVESGFAKRDRQSKILVYIKSKLTPHFIKHRFVYKRFLRYFGLPSDVAARY